MSNNSSFSLTPIQEELQLKALIHFSGKQGVIGHIGEKPFVNALLNSNVLAVFESDIAMPIRLSNDEIYEMVLKNNRGIVAKEGRANRYLVVLRIDTDNTLAAIGDDLDPGMVLFELLQYHK
ncbi:MAG: hypothetical protein KAT16_08910 [Candidatus Heimdallarchaeota archaeon]|nr:hypothetical protein [Candidatus Heimdallarchaeota archaeon]